LGVDLPAKLKTVTSYFTTPKKQIFRLKYTQLLLKWALVKVVKHSTKKCSKKLGVKQWACEEGIPKLIRIVENNAGA